MSTALAAANTARRASATAEKTLVTAEDKLQQLETRAGSLDKRRGELEALISDLEKKAAANPAKYKSALADAKAKLGSVEEQLKKLGPQLQAAQKEVKADRDDLTAKQKDALDKAQAANGNGASPNYYSRYVDGLEDAASLSKQQQRTLLGSEIRGVTPQAALKRDLAELDSALKGSDPKKALETLNNLLQGTDPTQQRALLDAMGPRVGQLAKLAYGSEAGANQYLDAMKGITPDARKKLVSALVDTAPQYVERSGVGLALAAKMKEGVGFETTRELTKAYLEKGDDLSAASLQRATAKGIASLKEDFNDKYQDAAKAKAELAMLESGFGAFMTPTERGAAKAAFLARNGGKVEAAEEAARKLSAALPEIENMFTDASRARPGFVQQSVAELKEEAKDLNDLTGKLSNTEAGQKAVRAALDESLSGKKTWLDEVVSHSKNTKEGLDGTAKLVTSAIVQKALSGGFVKKGQMLNALERFAPALGLDKEKIASLAGAFDGFDGSKEAVAKLEKSFKTLESDAALAANPTAKNSLKVIGLALSLHGVAKGLQGFSDADKLEKIKTLTETAKLGVEGGQFALEMLGKKGVVDALGKVSGGLNMFGGVLDVIGGIKGIADGNHAEGAADLMSGAGGLLMGAGTFGAGAAATGVGAALAVAGVLVKVGLAKYRANESEDKAQDDANAFLRAGGFSKKLADALDDVRQDNHTNTGEALQAVAVRMGWGMNMSYFQMKLGQLPEKDLKEFIHKLLDVKRNDAGQLEQMDQGRFDDAKGKLQSIETATEAFRALLEKNGLT